MAMSVPMAAPPASARTARQRRPPAQRRPHQRPGTPRITRVSARCRVSEATLLDSRVGSLLPCKPLVRSRQPHLVLVCRRSISALCRSRLRCPWAALRHPLCRPCRQGSGSRRRRLRGRVRGRFQWSPHRRRHRRPPRVFHLRPCRRALLGPRSGCLACPRVSDGNAARPDHPCPRALPCAVVTVFTHVGAVLLSRLHPSRPRRLSRPPRWSRK
mmetsp:Transcript_11918/g.37088  ORF Transcript_11918/g.37088 Transcript_11918/m.37088 type:complete len:214 (-) Transcript_11918:386-1027(-)